MARACIFCGKPAGSREDILPTWINGVLKQDPRGFRIPVNMKLTGDDGAVRQWQGKNQIRLITRQICHTCNTGWMSKLEESTLPHLSPLIKGETHVLGPDAQATIATWAIKTCLLLRFAHVRPARIASRWAEWLYQNRLPIPGWHVWLAAYNGKEPVWYDGRDVTLRAYAAPAWPMSTVVEDHGVLASLVLGYAVLQVLGLPDVRAPELPATHALKIAPASTAIQYWPPAQRLDDSSLPVFAQRLLNTPMPLTG